MQLRKVTLVPILIIALIASACDDEQIKRLARAGDDFSRGISVAFDIDAALLRSNMISRDDALVITTSLLELNRLGKQFHARLVAYSKLTPEARGQLLPIITELIAAANGLQRDGLLRIKNPQSQAEFAAALGVITAALATAQIILKGN
jgi:hypothetical protein